MAKRAEGEKAEEGFGFMAMLHAGDDEVGAFPFLNYDASYNARMRMLCFGGEEDELVAVNGLAGAPARPATGSEGSSSASSSSGNNKSLRKPKVKEGRTAPTAGAPKKPRKQPAPGGVGGGGTIRVRKERLGDRIATLQQLVSPFGKSDTASVLHEAFGYIKFLHDQVQVLSSPYLQQPPGSSAAPSAQGGELRRKGLCLVPMACTADVVGSNGADLWSPVDGSFAGDGGGDGDTKH